MASDWVRGTPLEIKNLVDTWGKETYYPLLGDQIELTESGDDIKVSIKVGFDHLKALDGTLLRFTPLGNLESKWIKVPTTPNMKLEVLLTLVMQNRTFKATQPPFPVMFCYTWKEAGTIVKSGLEGGGW